MSQRILILSASVGAGHLSAARAVELTLAEIAPDVDVWNLDVLDLTNAAFRQLYGKLYLDMIRRAPHVLGYLYDWLDSPTSTDWDRLRRLVQRLNLSRFHKLLEKERFDVIVNTHFLPAEIVASLRKSERIATPQVTVTTDFETHRLWVNQPCDHYFTATGQGKAYLTHLGVPAETISITGIPVQPAFSAAHDRQALLAKHGLAGDRPIVLQLAGGFGVGPMERIHAEILGIETPVELIAVCGRNDELKQHLESLPVPDRHRRRVLGFTTEMDEWMAVADVVVSKPGGLTSSEVLASGAAMLIVSPVPGQEDRNSDYLLECGAALKASNPSALGFKLAHLLRDPAQLQTLKDHARRIAQPQAARRVSEHVLQMIGATVPG